MKKDVYMYEWVQRYLDDQLTEAEKQQLNDRIENDESFAEEVDSYKTLLQGLEALGVESFKERLDTWEKRHQAGSGSGKKIPLRFQQYYAVAAVMLLLLLPLGYYLFVQSDNISPSDLYAEYYAPYEDVIIVRDTGTGSKLDRGMALYGQGNYDEAFKLLNAYSKEVPDDTSLILYLGIIELQKEAYEDALNYFSKAGTDPLMKEQSRWYSGLTYLKTGQLEKAKEIFEQIARTEGPHYKKNEATELLARLQ